LNKIRVLANVKIYLPQEPQEAFFWETIDIFQKGIQQLSKKLTEITYQ
jgi:hypothetical protein